MISPQISLEVTGEQNSEAEQKLKKLSEKLQKDARDFELKCAEENVRVEQGLTDIAKMRVEYQKVNSPPRSEEETTIATMANKELTEFGQCSTLAKDLKDSPKKLQAMRNVRL